MKEYSEDCIVCGEETLFDGPGELQEAVVSGKVGEYICKVCRESGKDVIIDG